MLLHRTRLIELEYDVQHDTLSFVWPSFTDIAPDELQHSFNLLIESIKHYDIKRLHINSKGSVADIPEKEFHDMIVEFSKYFLDTRLEKIARTASLDPEKESRTTKISDELASTVHSNIQFRNFPDEKSALAWLIE